MKKKLYLLDACFPNIDDHEEVVFTENPIYEWYPRTSTPLPERDISVLLNKNCRSQNIVPDFQYEMFRITLETRRFNFKLRGKTPVSADIISGHIRMFDNTNSVKLSSPMSSRMQNLGSLLSNKLVTTLTNLFKFK